MPNTYLAEFYVDNMRTRTEVVASNSSNAKKLVEAQYPNSKIRWVGTPKRID